MPFFDQGLLRYYAFNSLLDANVTHALFTRRGGVSPKPWASLNVGGTVGDDPSHVKKNRQRVIQSINKDPESIYDVWQVHGVNVICVEAPRPPNTPHKQADAMLTDKANVTLFMRFADCVPILLYDPHRCIVGIVHAGWQGTVQRIVAATVETMKKRYASSPADILAGIGPSICQRHYVVGEDVIDQVCSAFVGKASEILTYVNGNLKGPRAKLDLWTANRLILEDIGVKNIEISEVCTACNLEDWYSHRGESGNTGRFGGLISL